MRRLLPLALLLILSACEGEPENVQAKAETMSRQLEERANQIRAEAENGVEADAAPVEREADALLDRLAGNSAEANEANSQ